MPGIGSRVHFPSLIKVLTGYHLTSRRDFAGFDEFSITEIDARLKSAYLWLEQAFRATGGRGFSKGFNLFSGWMKSYPETSGYIISSLIKYSSIFPDGEAMKIARTTADWLLSQHNPDGGIPAIGKARTPSVAFDTGMVLHGYIDIYEATGNESYLQGARRCADFLVKTQNPDGSWTNCYQGIPHTYHARISWPLLQFGMLMDDITIRRAAEKNLAWVISQQADNGYWRNAYFTRRIPFANTHGLGYILEGLIESYRLAGKVEWLKSASKAAGRLAEAARAQNGYLASYLDSDWREVKVLPFSFACLTGIAQISRAWLLLHQIGREEVFREANGLGVNFVTGFQDTHIEWSAVRGALPGSAPIFGGYLPFQFPNWAVKFLIDLLIEQRDILKST